MIITSKRATKANSFKLKYFDVIGKIKNGMILTIREGKENKIKFLKINFCNL